MTPEVVNVAGVRKKSVTGESIDTFLIKTVGEVTVGRGLGGLEVAIRERKG